MDSKEFYIAGVKFHQMGTVIKELDEGMELDLLPEPDNKFDANAVKIMYEDVMCGYVPKTISADVAAALELGKELICTIIELDPTKPTYEQCKVAIEDIEVE